MLHVWKIKKKYTRMPVGASLNNLFGLGFLCMAHTFSRASSWIPITVWEWWHSTTANPPFVAEAARALYKLQVVCSEHRPVQ